MKRTDRIWVRSSDIGADGGLRASALAQYLEQSAYLSVLPFGKGEEELSVKLISLGAYGDPSEGDELLLESSAEKAGEGCTRWARLYKDGTLLAELNSLWIPLSEKRRAKTLEDELFRNDGISLELPGDMEIPAEMRLALVGEVPVRYGNTDKSLSRRSSDYAEMLLDFIPEREKKRLLLFNCNFFAEAELGDTEKIYCGSLEEDVYWFRTVKKNGEKSAEAQLIVESV